MDSNKKIYKGNRITFTKEKELDSGGNGSVHSINLISSDDKVKHKNLVVKFLKKYQKKNTARFKEEIEALSNLKNIKGIIPIVDYFYPNGLVLNEKPWYAMPRAKTLNNINFYKDLALKEKIDLILELAKTLEEIHEKEYSHRDIKPANILFYNKQLNFSDFGLSLNQKKRPHLTGKFERVGPWNTMAPEMKRDSSHQKGYDYRSADVYSFAKTLWILITGNDECFDGQYLRKVQHSLQSNDFEEKYIETIEELLESSTNENALERPNIKKFIEKLEEWISIVSDEKKLNDEVNKVNTKDFIKNITPNYSVFKTYSDIYNYLQMFSFKFDSKINFCLTVDSINHSKLKNCLELETNNGIYVIKPISLTIQNIKEGYRIFLNIDNINEFDSDLYEEVSASLYLMTSLDKKYLFKTEENIEILNIQK